MWSKHSYTLYRRPTVPAPISDSNHGLMQELFVRASTPASAQSEHPTEPSGVPGVIHINSVHRDQVIRQILQLWHWAGLNFESYSERSVNDFKQPLCSSSKGRSERRGDLSPKTLLTGLNLALKFPCVSIVDQVLELPPGARVLATSKRCPVEIFALGDSVLGIQGYSI